MGLTSHAVWNEEWGMRNAADMDGWVEPDEREEARKAPIKCGESKIIAL